MTGHPACNAVRKLSGKGGCLNNAAAWLNGVELDLNTIVAKLNIVGIGLLYE